jgi:tRNA dimethylallyltransferase
MKKITIVTGPTASGKTSYAIELAKKIAGEIINADSLQIYKENPIISAQPSLAERQNIPHHLFGYIDGDEEYTIARWIADVKQKIEQIETPIIVGGTGFYLKHLIFGLSAIPDTPEEIRINARNLLQKIGNQEFFKLLQAMDPTTKLDANNTHRVLRSYEVIKSTGKNLDYWQQNNIAHFPIDAFKLIILDPPREQLYLNCNQRFVEMLENGAIDEVRHMLELGYMPMKGVMKSHGVPELLKFLSGEWSLSQAIEKAQQVTRNYAKRQVTWFKHQFKSDDLEIIRRF